MVTFVLCLGERLNSTSTYYYTENRKRCRFPWPSRNLVECEDVMDDIENEPRVSIKAKMAKETGFTGRSQLMRLWFLYGFDVLKDTVYDMMHNILMNLVKKFLDYLVESDQLNEDEVEYRLTF